MIDKQITFDSVVNGLRKQGRAAIGIGGCKFKTESGLKCAVGQLIPDEEYRPGFDDPHSTENAFDLVVLTKGHSRDLLFNLQTCHDMNDVKDWETIFQSIAKRYDLVYTPVN